VAPSTQLKRCRDTGPPGFAGPLVCSRRANRRSREIRVLRIQWSLSFSTLAAACCSPAPALETQRLTGRVGHAQPQFRILTSAHRRHDPPGPDAAAVRNDSLGTPDLRSWTERPPGIAVSTRHFANAARDRILDRRAVLVTGTAAPAPCSAPAFLRGHRAHRRPDRHRDHRCTDESPRLPLRAIVPAVRSARALDSILIGTHHAETACAAPPVPFAAW